MSTWPRDTQTPYAPGAPHQGATAALFVIAEQHACLRAGQWTVGGMDHIHTCQHEKISQYIRVGETAVCRMSPWYETYHLHNL